MRFVSMFVAIVVVVAACGGSDTEAGSGESTSSPIAEFLGQPDFLSDEEGAREQIVAQERESEQRVAECMSELGFEYVPRDVDDTIFFGGGTEEEFGTDEWVEKYGFGITTTWFSQEQVGPDLLGYDDAAFQDQVENDPNQAIVDAMSESEQEAYYDALYGDQDEFFFDETLSDEEIEAQLEDQQFDGPGGCQGEAWEANPTTRFYEEFGEEIQALEEEIAADPRIVEAEQEIADCVADRGLEYTPGIELFEKFEPALQEIESTIDYSAIDDAYADLEEGEEPDFDTFEMPELSEEGKAKLAELQAEEIELAVAVNECGGGFDDQQAVYAEVRAEYEQTWLDDNADRVADYAGS